MQQYTSEQALNGILNILETTINQYNEKQKNASTSQSSTLIEELLAGVGASASKGVDLGASVKMLADGMSLLKTQGITPSDAQDTAFMISVLGKAVAGLEFNPVSTDAVLSIAQSLAILGKIDKDIIKNIAYIASTLDAQQATNIAQFLKTLNIDDVENVAKVIGAINDFSKIDPKSAENIDAVVRTLNVDSAA